MAAVRLNNTKGTLVSKSAPGRADNYTQDEAEASAAERNERAEALGIKGRYVVTDD